MNPIVIKEYDQLVKVNTINETPKVTTEEVVVKIKQYEAVNVPSDTETDFPLDLATLYQTTKL